MTRYLLSSLFFFFVSVTLLSQTGLLKIDEERIYDGYTLIYPHSQPNVLLLNNCGEVVHQWEDDDVYRAGNTAYLLESGDLIKTKRHFDFSNDSIWAGGAGAIVEGRSWDNDLLWSYELNNEKFRLHHDIEPLPNGNVLMIAWENITEAEAIELGRDPELIRFGELWGEKIMEYDPILDSIVWEWRVFDNVIQDYDSSKLNFGVVCDHPEKIDINKESTNGREDWLHANSVDYNPLTDEIMLDVPFLGELWVFKRGTKDEGLTFRWGNPANYCGQQSDQKLFNPHDGHWVFDFLDESDPRYGKIAVFNNRYSSNSSAAHILDPYDESGEYYFNDENFGPDEFLINYFYPSQDSILSAGLSCIRSLPGGNTLLVYGKFGLIVELTEDDEIVWEYKVPLRKGVATSRSDDLLIDENLLFNAIKYPADFTAFDDKDLAAIGFIEVEQEFSCETIITSNREVIISNTLEAFPNPASTYLQIKKMDTPRSVFRILDIRGQAIKSGMLTKTNGKIDITDIETGIYFLVVANQSTKFIKL